MVRDRLSVNKREKQGCASRRNLCFMLNYGLNGDEVCFCEVGIESFKPNVKEIFTLLL
jgi:hypothetical protein